MEVLVLSLLFTCLVTGDPLLANPCPGILRLQLRLELGSFPVHYVLNLLQIPSFI